MNLNPLFLIDFYKAGHHLQYPKDTEKVYSNWTPRASRVPEETHVVHFGLQYFIKKYLMEEFQTNFFDRDLYEVTKEYQTVLAATLGGNPSVSHIAALHRLGYLPIEIWSLPEGVRVPLRVPAVVITNTRPEFYWLPNYLETILSNILWKPSTSATTALRFRRIFETYAKAAGETDFSFIDWQGHDFSFRGMSGVEDAVLSGMGHLLSFSGTDTLPAILTAKRYYGAELTVGGSVPATEHSVMCAGGETSEKETFRRLITETYPDGIVSIVSDTWDLWHVLRHIVPDLRADIMARNGKIVIRPDSGDPVKIMIGDSAELGNNYESYSRQQGALRLLANALGTDNAYGRKHINKGGLIYGDGISPERAEAILKGAVNQGYSPYNIVFGIGSFTYEYQTRDTYGFAMKATAVVRDGKLVDIFKDPKTDDGLKKSLKGIPFVHGLNGHYAVVEGVTESVFHNHPGNAMNLVYQNGELKIDETFQDIRNRVRNGVD